MFFSAALFFIVLLVKKYYFWKIWKIFFCKFRMDRVPNPNGHNSVDGHNTLMSSLAAHGMYTSRPAPMPQRQSLIRPQSRSIHHFNSQNSLRPRQADTRKDVYTWTVGKIFFFYFRFFLEI